MINDFVHIWEWWWHHQSLFIRHFGILSKHLNCTVGEGKGTISVDILPLIRHCQFLCCTQIWILFGIQINLCFFHFIFRLWKRKRTNAVFNHLYAQINSIQKKWGVFNSITKLFKTTNWKQQFLENQRENMRMIFAGGKNKQWMNEKKQVKNDTFCRRQHHRQHRNI